MQGSSAVHGVSFRAETTIIHPAVEVPDGIPSCFQNCSCAAVLQSCPTGPEAHSTICSWVPGKIRPCFKGDLLKEKENAIVVIFRHQPKLHTGFFSEIAFGLLWGKLLFFFFFLFSVSSSLFFGAFIHY